MLTQEGTLCAHILMLVDLMWHAWQSALCPEEGAFHDVTSCPWGPQRLISVWD